MAHQRALEQQVEQLKNQAGSIGQLADLEAQARTLKGVKVLSARVDGMDRQQMRDAGRFAAQQVEDRQSWCSPSAADSNVSIVSAVTKDLTAKVHAGKLVGAVAQAVGGKGGGRPDMAEAGGKDRSALPAALEEVYSIGREQCCEREFDALVVGAGPDRPRLRHRTARSAA